MRKCLTLGALLAVAFAASCAPSVPSPSPSTPFDAPSPSRALEVEPASSPSPLSQATARLSPIPGSMTGTFTPEVKFAYPTQEYTATLLDDGKVLVAGGAGNPTGDWRLETLSLAQLFDPSTATFAPTGSMTSARQCHTATPLDDGKVLIAGGWTAGPQGQSLSSAELYDPATGTFSGTGSMTSERCRARSTRLADGRVLIAGGQDGSSRAVNSAELYDPKAGTFSPAGAFAVDYATEGAVDLYSLTLLGDGRVLLIGNTVSGALVAVPGPEPREAAQLYDPTDNTFRVTGTPLLKDAAPTQAVLLADGRVLETGDGADVYDPDTGVFSATGTVHIAVIDAVRLADSRVLVTGIAPPDFERSVAEIYDPPTGRFTPLATGSVPANRAIDTVIPLGDGSVLFLSANFFQVFRP